MRGGVVQTGAQRCAARRGAFVEGYGRGGVQVVYKKLLNGVPTFVDLMDAQPSLAKGLEALLQYDGDDLADVFCRSFEAEFDVLDTVRPLASGQCTAVQAPPDHAVPRAPRPLGSAWPGAIAVPSSCGCICTPLSYACTGRRPARADAQTTDICTSGTTGAVDHGRLDVATVAGRHALCELQKVKVELTNGGSDVPVTKHNRQEFVNLFVDWCEACGHGHLRLSRTAASLPAVCGWRCDCGVQFCLCHDTCCATLRYLNQSISDVFEEFKAGFYSVASGSSLVLFNAHELELLVCGLPHLDFGELERATAYEGYTGQDATIQNLWRIVHSFSLEEKKRFLSFVTGCNRAPMGYVSLARGSGRHHTWLVQWTVRSMCASTHNMYTSCAGASVSSEC